MIADYMKQTNNAVEAVNRDYLTAGNTGKLPPALELNWVEWLKGWRSFYKSNQSSWSGGTVDRAEDYRNQLGKWRALVSKHTPLTSPAPHIDPTNPLWSFGGGAGFGALIAIGAVLYLMSRTGGAASLPREA